jgi:hypothetical protein
VSDFSLETFFTQVDEAAGISELQNLWGSLVSQEAIPRRLRERGALKIRKRVRYLCFRIANEMQAKTNIERAVEAGKMTKKQAAARLISTRAPKMKGFRHHYESLPQFEGWDQFAKTWDINLDQVDALDFSTVDPFALRYRLRSVYDEWDDEVRRASSQSLGALVIKHKQEGDRAAEG